MKLRKSDWALIGLLVAYVTLLGPFLISARDWFLLAGGFAAGLGLIYWAVEAVIYHTETNDNA